MKPFRVMYLVVVSLLFTVHANADTAPLTPGDPWGGGINFTCDDNPGSPECGGCEDPSSVSTISTQEDSFEPVNGLSEGSTQTTQFDTDKEETTTCLGDEPGPRCFVSKNPKNYDKCIWSGKGPVCGTDSSGAKKCCEHPIGADGKPDKSGCTCSSVKKAGSDTGKCADCLCLAEAANQKPKPGQEGGPRSANPDPLLCKKLMQCVLHGDAAALSPGNPDSKLCDAALGVVAGSDSWRYSAARCVCDRSTGSGDNRGTNGNGEAGYNQAFCDCIEGKTLDKASKAALADCKKARESTDCSKYPFDHYATGSSEDSCPCAKDRVRSIQVCGDHVFCDCR